MWDEMIGLQAAVRQLQTQIKSLLPEQPPPPVVGMDDPEKAKLLFEAAEAEVKEQEDRAKLRIKEAEDNLKRAKEILDKSVATAKAAEQAQAQAQAPARQSEPDRAAPQRK